MRLARLAWIAPVTLAFGCSSKAMTPPADPPSVTIPLATPASPPASSWVAPAPSAVSPPAANPPIVRLPDQPYDPYIPTARSIDWAAGQLPSASLPAGTVYVATHESATNDAPLSITEWDLARAAIVRSVALPVRLEEWEPSILRVGDHLHVLADGITSHAYLQLGLDLHVEHVERWTGSERYRDVDAFSANEELTTVTYVGTVDGVSNGQEARVVVVFDASGRRHKAGILERPGHDLVLQSRATNTVVLGDRIFVVLSPDGVDVELLRLTPELRVEKRIVVSKEWTPAASLWASEGHLQVTLGFVDASRTIDYSTNLEKLGDAVPAERSGPLKLGREEVWLCRRQERAWLAWTTTPGDVCAAGPAELMRDHSVEPP